MRKLGRRRGWTVGLVVLGLTLALVALSSAVSGQKTTAHPTRATSVSIAADGRQREVVLTGVIDGVDSPKEGRLEGLIQQLTEKHGHWLWATRVRRHIRNRSSAFSLTWHHPPSEQPLILRIALVGRGQLVALSRAISLVAGDPGAVFYSGEKDAGAPDVNGSSVVRLVESRGFLGLGPAYDGQWRAGNCNTSDAVPSQLPANREPITELAGFSIGRLGPIYFLDDHPAWESQISYILLFDPGSASEMLASCDTASGI